MSNKVYNNLTELKSDIQKCKKCELHKSRKMAVPGSGPKNANVILIGEAPGAEEDTNGKPFCGRGGKLLDKVISNNNLFRKKFYVTNIVKCRPPNNRVPNTNERNTCQEYLKQEISIIKPKLICILGNTAFNSILGGSEITKFRGKVVRKNNLLYFLTIHPAATIYNQKLIDVLKNDIVKLFDLIRDLKNNKEVPIDIEYTS